MGNQPLHNNKSPLTLGIFLKDGFAAGWILKKILDFKALFKRELKHLFI